MPQPDLVKAYNTLTSHKSSYETLDAYYQGDQPTVWLTERLKDLFRGVNIEFTQNWCAVVIDSVKERLNLTGFQVEDETVQAKLDEIWERNQLSLESDDVHETALVQGSAAMIAWPDEGGQAECYFHCPAMVHVEYSAEKPRQVAWAAKLWSDDDGYARMTLYYPNTIEYYRTTKRVDGEKRQLDASAFLAMDPPDAPNPYGQVPVFHFRPNRHNRSDLRNVIPIQNGINKLLADMIVAAEYGAFAQRWTIGNFESTGKLSSQPGEYHHFPAGDGVGQQTQVGEFSVTPLTNFLQPIDKLAESISAITRTPKHYFFGQGGQVSGEALIALEAPLNKKVQDRINRFIPTWQELAAFLLYIEGVTVAPTDITPVFDVVETVQPRTSAEIVKIETEYGLPLVTALRRQGWSDAEIQQMLDDKKKADSEQKKSFAAALMQAQRDMDAGQNEGAGVYKTKPNQSGDEDDARKQDGPDDPQSRREG